MTLLLIVLSSLSVFSIFYERLIYLVTRVASKKGITRSFRYLDSQRYREKNIAVRTEQETFKSFQKGAFTTDKQADKTLNQIFEFACPTSNNCLEILVLLEQLEGRVSPIHLKRMRQLFNVYGSTNHLFDAAFVRIVGSCSNCIEKFELIEHVYTRSRFYPSIARTANSQGRSDVASFRKVRLG